MSDAQLYTFTVEVYTDGLIITGSYDLPLYRRVSDALNSGLYRYMTLRDATIAPQQHPQQVQRVPQLLTAWSNALLVTTIAEPEPPPDFRTVAAPVRDEQPMMFFTSLFALRASFYKRPSYSLSEAMEQISDEFIPLSSVQIFPLNGGASFTRTFACLRHSCIEALYPIGTAVKPPTAAPAAPLLAPIEPVEPAPPEAEA